MRRTLLEWWDRWNAIPAGRKTAIRVVSSAALAVVTVGGGFLAAELHIAVLVYSLFVPMVFVLSCVAFAAEGSLGFARLAAILSVAAAVVIAAHAAAYLQTGLAMPMLEDGTPEPLTARDAVYFSILTFTTLGYGDIQPLPDYRVVAALEALYGYVFLGLLVGLLANAASPGHGRSE